MVPLGRDVTSVIHVVSVALRAALIFGNITPGDAGNLMKYTMERVPAFVNAFKPLDDVIVACGAGAIALGFPVITNETENIFRVPKSLIVQEDVSKFNATSLEARDIKIKITKIDIPLSPSPLPSRVRSSARATCRWKWTAPGWIASSWFPPRKPPRLRITRSPWKAPSWTRSPWAPRSPLSYTVEVAGKNMQTDFESVMERKFHSYLNCVEGVMHTGQRDMIRIRISKADFEAGFRFKHIGEVLYAKIKSEFEAVVDKCQVKIVVDAEKNHELRHHANEVFAKRDDRLKSMTDESVPVYYTCIMCQAFSPSHVCIVTPERLGLCGAVSWLDAKATNELDPQGPCQIVPRTAASTRTWAVTRTWTKPSLSTLTALWSMSPCTLCSRTP